MKDCKIGFGYQTFELNSTEFDIYNLIALSLIYLFHVYKYCGKPGVSLFIPANIRDSVNSVKD